MHRFNISKKLFDFEEDSSEGSADSVVYISSVEEEDEVSDCWDTDWSTDTEAMIKRIEREVKSSPILIGGRIMTTEGLDDEMEAGPSNPQPIPPSTPKLGFKYFDEKLCYAPSRKSTKPKIELCSIVLPVLESPMSPVEHEKGLLRTPRCLVLLVRLSTRPTTSKMSNRMQTWAIRDALPAWCAANL